MARKPDPEARGKLLSAARAAFAESGVEGARVEDIARTAGLSKGAFYLHFESKDAVFEELATTFFGAMGELSAQRHEATVELRSRIGVPTTLDWATASPVLRAYAELDHQHTVATLRALWRNRDMLRCLLGQPAPRHTHLVERFVALSRDMLARQLQEAAEHCGMRPDLDRELVSELIIAMYVQLARRMVRSSARPDFDQWARTVNTLISEGIAARDAAVASLPFPVDPPSQPADRSVSHGAR